VAYPSLYADVANFDHRSKTEDVLANVGNKKIHRYGESQMLLNTQFAAQNDTQNALNGGAADVDMLMDGGGTTVNNSGANVNTNDHATNSVNLPEDNAAPLTDEQRSKCERVTRQLGKIRMPVASLAKSNLKMSTKTRFQTNEYVVYNADQVSFFVI